MSLLPRHTALTRILEAMRPLSAEDVALDAAAGRVLAETVIATRDLPGFDNSAMDGYAVRAADAIQGAHLHVQGELPAGTAACAALGSGAAMRIFTGAPLPPGADTVVMQENTTRDGEQVVFNQAAQLNRHVRAAGSDVAQGDTLLSPGRIVSAGDIALLTSQGRSRARVVRAPIVAIVDTGDELIRVDGGAPQRGQVVASNAIALAAAVRAVGGVPRILPTLPDTHAAVSAGLAQAIQGADVLITVGGMSVGDYDFMLDGIKALSGDGFAFWKVAVKPGKPLAFAQAGGTAIFGLPGNPVSALVTFELFVRPALLALMGHTAVLRRFRTAIADVDLPKGGRRETFLRAIAWRDAHGLRVRPRNNQSSGALSSIGGVDALVQIPIDAPSLPAGEPAQVLLLGPDHPLDRLPLTAGA